MAVVATAVIGATVGAPEVDRAGACLDPMAVTDNPGVRARTGRTASRADFVDRPLGTTGLHWPVLFHCC